MRITIELDEEKRAAVADVTAQAAQAAEDGGAAAASLAAAAGEGLSDAAAYEDMGPPPSWLVAAIEAAVLSEGAYGSAAESSAGEVSEGGKAPD